MKINIIAAVAENGAIGKGGQLLWHISEDMKYFRNVTLGCPVIMGRKTFESIGRPLPGRTNIVISRQWETEPEGTVVARSLEEAMQTAMKSISSAQDCFVIGGGEIYRQAMPLADRLYVTEVHTAVNDADTFFPEINPEIWREVSRTARKEDPDSGLEFDFAVYEKVS